MLFDNFRKIKKVLGKENIKKFYYLIPLDIITSILELISISIIIPFVIAISDKEKVVNSEYSKFFLEYFESYDSFLLALVIGLLIISFISTLLSILATSAKISLINKIGQNVRQTQYKKYLMAEYKFHINFNKTELSKNLMTEVERFTFHVLMAGLLMISKSFFLLLLLCIMIVINPTVSIVVVTSLSLIYLLIYSLLRTKLESNGKNISTANTKLYSIIDESYNGIKETKFYSLENFYSNKFNQNSDLIGDKTASSQIISAVPKNLIEFILFAAIISIIIFLNQTNNLLESLPVISFFLYSGYRALPAFQQVYNSSSLLRANFESVNRILESNELIKNNDLVENNLIKKDFTFKSIELKKVNFSFNKHKEIFKDFSFRIESPGFVGIIGESGSGKSTLVDLFLKLNHPNSGEILINNNEYTYGDARSLFAYVPQNIFLSDSNFLENIHLGNINESINNELVKSSYTLAGLQRLIEDLPEKLLTGVGENGTWLSGGQRKRLGLARAFYSQKPILILDEVTSGLDSVTEELILNDLKKISKNKLIILVTHNTQKMDIFDKTINLNRKLDE